MSAKARRGGVVRLSLVALAFASLAPACKDDDGAPPPTATGDVREACEQRATWKNRLTDACRSCVAIATNPPCACPDAQRGYAGACNEQHTRRANEPSCAGVEACVTACSAGDCDCVDGCYAGKDACRTIASSLDACVVEACAPECG